MNINSQGLTIGEFKSVRSFKPISTDLLHLDELIYLLS